MRRYFKAKPEAQKLFSEFANVSITDLPNNHDFLNAAYSCVSSLEFILPHLRSQHPERCPALTDLKNKYSVVDLKVKFYYSKINHVRYFLMHIFIENRSSYRSGWRPCKKRWATLIPTTSATSGRRPCPLLPITLQPHNRIYIC